MPRFIRGIESSTSRTPTGRRRKTHASSISNSLASPAVDPPLRPPSSTSNPYSNNMMNHSASLNVSHNQHIHRTRSNTQQAEAAFTLSSMAAQHTNMAWTSTARRDNDRNSTYSPECHQRTVSELVYPTGAAAGGTCSVRKNPGLGNVSASRMVELDIVVKSLNEQNADLASKVESANAKNADLASKLESAHASMNDMDMKLAVEKQAHNEAVIKSSSKLEKVASRIVDLDDKVKSLNERNADLASKLESANTSMNGMSKSLLFEKQAHSEAVIKCMDLRSLVKQAHNDAVIKCSKLEKASLRIVDLDDKVESLNKQNTELGGKLVAADAIMNGMSEKFSVEKHSHNEAVIKCSKFEKEIADYKIAAKLVDKLCKTLEHEQKAHSAAVAMSLDLEKKLATMKSIDKHSDGYRAFATKAESRLLDSNDDRKKRRREETDCDAYFHLQQRHLSNEDDFEYISDEVARERIEELKRLVSLYEAKLLKSETSQSDCVDSGFIADKGGGSSAHGQASAETIDILAVSVKPSQPPCNDIKGEDPQPFRYEYGRVVITIDSDSDSD
jgi:hypothetical protein